MACIVETRYGRFRVGHPSFAPAVLACVRVLDRVSGSPAYIERRDCGTGAGGFKPGNKCAGGEGGGSDSGDGGGGDGEGGSDPGSPASRYREAKTKEEAEAVARQYAKKVSFRGVDVESANRINKAVDEFFQQHPDMPQLESIEAKKFTGSSSTGDESAPAGYHMLSHKMQVNTAIMGSQKKFDEYVRKADEATAAVKKALADGRLQGRQKELAEMHVTRGSVIDRSLSGCITHEMGHHFDATVLMKMPTADRKALMDRRAEYEPKLSAYASTNAFEYFAESYVAYRVGREGDIDPELRAIFENRGGKK